VNGADESNTCGICFNDYKCGTLHERVIIHEGPQWKHSYCAQCIATLGEERRCPSCRIQIEAQQWQGVQREVIRILHKHGSKVEFRKNMITISFVNMVFLTILYFFNSRPEQTAELMSIFIMSGSIFACHGLCCNTSLQKLIWTLWSIFQIWYLTDIEMSTIQVMNVKKNFGMISISHFLSIVSPLKHISLTMKVTLLALFTALYALNQNGLIFFCFLIFLF
jgi:hypothetical protein